MRFYCSFKWLSASHFLSDGKEKHVSLFDLNRHHFHYGQTCHSQFKVLNVKRLQSCSSVSAPTDSGSFSGSSELAAVKEMDSKRGETKEKVMILKGRKYRSDNERRKVRQSRLLHTITMAGVHCAKCHIITLSILFQTALFPSRRSLMASGEPESHF